MLFNLKWRSYTSSILHDRTGAVLRERHLEHGMVAERQDAWANRVLNFGKNVCEVEKMPFLKTVGISYGTKPLQFNRGGSPREDACPARLPLHTRVLRVDTRGRIRRGCSRRWRHRRRHCRGLCPRVKHLI